MTRQTLSALVINKRTLFILFCLAAVFTSVQLYLLGTHPFIMPRASTIPADIMNQPRYMNLYIGRQMTEYNNYLIYKYSWYHLVQGADLYGIYPSSHWDFYKYSPTFALFMGTMAWLPDVVGLCIWNLINALCLFFAVRLLPFNLKTQCLLLWFVFNELLTCISNTQSNGIICGLIIAAFGCMDRGKVIWAALWLVIATYIKVYGAIGCCLFLFYPDKMKFAGYVLLWTVVLAVLPLLVTPFSTLVWQYHNWASLMVADASKATGLSVNGWLQSWFGLTGINNRVLIAGLLLFFLPFARVNLYADKTYRLLALASMLIWVIIFNHKAESATYIIAVTGVAIWYFALPATGWRTSILFFVLVFTSLSSTDFFPSYVRSHFIQPYRIKAFPCIVAWIAVIVDLMTLKIRTGDEKERKIPEFH